jgi:3alpha(or 20beta)-hydroxysteroid dehydrogenase
MLDLTGRVALISGGARGLGAAHGEVFASLGARVMLGDIDREGGAAAASAAGVAFTPLDVTSERSWADAVADTVATHGRIDVLVNNAGICPVGFIEDTSAELFSQVLAVNTLGVFLGMQAAARAMEPGGVIINVASIDGLRGVAGLSAYGASKAALKSLSKTAALEFAPKGISVLCLHPGGIDTAMMYESGNKLMALAGAADIDINDALKATIPQGRVARPAEIAEWSAFLVAKGAAVATGSDFVIDGGYTAGGNAGI